MGAILNDSFAAGVGAGLTNKQFAVEVDLVQRKHLLVGSYDPNLSATVEDNTPVRVTSPDDVAAQFGRGFALHRMALGAERGSYFYTEVWVLPQPESDSPAAVKAVGSVVLSNGPATKAGSLVLYIGNDKVSVPVAVGDTVTTVGNALKAAINANTDLPVTASGTSPTIAVTSKTGGTFGNYISMTMGWGGDKIPTGLTVTITQLGDGTLGANDPDINDALDALGTGDSANADYYTDVNFSYGLDDDEVLDAISTYVGVGNEKTGCYSETVQRPFRSLYGDTTPSAGGLSAAVAIAADHTYNRATGVVCAPGSPVHPCELACQVMGVQARLNSVRAEETSCGQVLFGIIPGLKSEQWTTEYSNRDYAVKNGVGTTKEDAGVLLIQDVLTFYRPSNVAIKNNGYRSQRNISILQNIGTSIRKNFLTEKWKGCSIVDDVANVGDSVDREKARDKGMVLDDMLALTDAWGNKAWLYSKKFTIDKIKNGSTIVLRPGGKGFNTTIPIILSGEGTIFNNAVEFDTSITVTL